MKVKFIKDHVSGFKEGAVVDLRDSHAKSLFDKGFVVFDELTEEQGSSEVPKEESGSSEVPKEEPGSSEVPVSQGE